MALKIGRDDFEPVIFFSELKKKKRNKQNTFQGSESDYIRKQHLRVSICSEECAQGHKSCVLGLMLRTLKLFLESSGNLPSPYDPCLRVSVAVIKHHDPEQLVQERVGFFQLAVPYYNHF